MKLLFALPLLFTLPAIANDSIGGVSAGGIVFRNTDAIAMKKEVLTVSARLITVDYEFVNESVADVEETVIFPLPSYPAATRPNDGYYGQPDAFSIEVDGIPVKFRSVVLATIGGVDVTAKLRKVGLTDAQIAYHATFGNALSVKRLTAQQRQQLVKLNMFAEGPTGEMDAAWDIKVNYVWQQKFPANKVVRVHHAYRPFVAAGPGEDAIYPETEKSYCMDAAFLKSRDRYAANFEKTGDGYLQAAKVSYILMTGNHWKRGIEDFTLNLVKSAPSDLISLCFPGKVSKLDAKTYQVHLKNFRPTTDLEVYFGSTELRLGNEGKMPAVGK